MLQNKIGWCRWNGFNFECMRNIIGNHGTSGIYFTINVLAAMLARFEFQFNYVIINAEFRNGALAVDPSTSVPDIHNRIYQTRCC